MCCIVSFAVLDFKYYTIISFLLLLLLLAIPKCHWMLVIDVTYLGTKPGRKLRWCNCWWEWDQTKEMFLLCASPKLSLQWVSIILTQSPSWLWFIFSSLLPSVQLLAVLVPPPLSWLSLVRGVPPSDVLTALWGAVPSRLPAQLPIRLPSVGVM